MPYGEQDRLKNSCEKELVCKSGGCLYKIRIVRSHESKPYWKVRSRRVGKIGHIETNSERSVLCV